MARVELESQNWVTPYPLPFLAYRRPAMAPAGLADARLAPAPWLTHHGAPHGLGEGENMHHVRTMRGLLLSLTFLLPAPATAHDWYNGLHARDGALCCNQSDCHELVWSQVRRAPDGELELLIEGRWLPVPYKAILPIKSRDGHVHACWPAGSEQLVCVILPPEA